jgi:hypothetical protein
MADDKPVRGEKTSLGWDEGSPTRTEQTENAKVEDSPVYAADLHERPANNLNVVFENPLASLPRDRLLTDVEEFCKRYNLEQHVDAFRKGALVSQNPSAAQDLVELTDEEKEVLRREHTHKWHQPWQLYWLVGK